MAKTSSATAEAPARPDDPAAAAPAIDLGAVVEDWFRAHVHNSPASRDTHVFNHLVRAAEQLKADLAKAINQ